MGKFGWDTEKVHHAIRQNRRMFDREPIGPLGACLSLSDDKWAKAAEAACGRALDMWLVHGAHDHVALKKVWRRQAISRYPSWSSTLTQPRTTCRVLGYHRGGQPC